MRELLIKREEFVIYDRLSYKKRFEKARQLRELTAKKIALDERLDSHIDKALKRLAHLKAFKQIAQTSTLEIVDQTDKDRL